MLHWHAKLFVWHWYYICVTVPSTNWRQEFNTVRYLYSIYIVMLASMSYCKFLWPFHWMYFRKTVLYTYKGTLIMSTHLIYVIWLSSYFEESDVGGLSAPFLLPYTFWRIFVLFKHLLSLKKNIRYIRCCTRWIYRLIFIFRGNKRNIITFSYEIFFNE